jgi:hypothetical protein
MVWGSVPASGQEVETGAFGSQGAAVGVAA